MVYSIINPVDTPGSPSPSKCPIREADLSYGLRESIEEDFREALARFREESKAERHCEAVLDRCKRVWQMREERLVRLREVYSETHELVSGALHGEMEAKRLYLAAEESRNGTRERCDVAQRELTGLAVQFVKGAEDETKFLAADWFRGPYFVSRWAKVRSREYCFCRSVTEEIRRRFPRATWLREETSCISTEPALRKQRLKLSYIVRRGGRPAATREEREDYYDDVASAQWAYPVLKGALTELRKYARRASKAGSKRSAEYASWLLEDLPATEPIWESARQAKRTLRRYTRGPFAAPPPRRPGRKRSVQTDSVSVVRELSGSIPPSGLAKAILAEWFRVPVAKIGPRAS